MKKIVLLTFIGSLFAAVSAFGHCGTCGVGGEAHKDEVKACCASEGCCKEAKAACAEACDKPCCKKDKAKCGDKCDKPCCKKAEETAAAESKSCCPAKSSKTA